MYANAYVNIVCWLCCGCIGSGFAQALLSGQSVSELPSDYCRLPPVSPGNLYFSVFCYNEDASYTECLNVPGTPVRPNWTVTHICQPGFYLPRNHGYVDSRCLGGQWVPPPPICRDRVCSLLNDPVSGRYVSHPLDCTDDCGAVDTRLRDNSLLRLQCIGGYAPELDDTALCVAGEWILPGGCRSGSCTCKKVTTTSAKRQADATILSEVTPCQLPEPPEHGTYFSTACYSPGPLPPECMQTPGVPARHSWSLTFLCDDGYLPDNNQTLFHSKCVRGRWVPNPPQCTVSLEEGCTVPNHPAHGQYAVSCEQPECTTVPGMQVPRSHKLTLSCDTGYRPSQAYALFTCTKGRWSPPPPTCQESSLILLEQRDISLLQSQFKECVLPQPPVRGRYSLFSVDCQGGQSTNTSTCQKAPGETVPHLQVLSFSCDSGYRLGEQAGSTFLASCDDGKWSQAIPKCYKPCPALTSLTVDIECFQGPRSVPCDSPMLPDSTAVPRCKLNHATIDDPRDLICKADGKWSGRLPDCRPNCGLSKLNQYEIVPTITDGVASPLGYFPWHAGIFHRGANNSWDAKCGGTLISPHIILTAAHCVTNRATKMNCEDVRVALGKYYRDWNIEEDETVKKEVKSIQIQPNYLGKESFLDLDIALLALDSPVSVSSFIMPVCVDYHRSHHLQPGMVGYLAGWGKTEECDGDCGDPSGVLLYTNTSFLEFRECYEAMQRLYFISIARITSDKFCAGNGSKSVAQRGDSGGGITFVFNNVHFIKGVISAKISYQDKYSFSAFTNVSTHINWVTRIASYLDSIVN